MLVLSRRASEGVVVKLGPQVVRVVIVEIRGDKVRVGFEADKAVAIHRDEVAKAIERQEAEGRQGGAA